VKVCTKQHPKDADMIEIDTTIDALSTYSSHENIVQTYKPTEANLNEDELIEVYVVA
jgi:hypothetical protein